MAIRLSLPCSAGNRLPYRPEGRYTRRSFRWRELPSVALADLRPGDLVVYFEDAGHVGLYLGDGEVVHAPRPGGRVQVSPLAANPVLGAVRPDKDARPLARYQRPPLPEGAKDGKGHSGGKAP